jgi:methylaspartate mutase sigma subunit
MSAPDTLGTADPARREGLPADAGPRGTVVVSTMASDSHTWNLVYLHLLIEELGYEVVNLGPCVPDELLVERCREIAPALVVLSSVNGHGHQDGLRVVHRLRACPELAATPMVIGGKLAITDEHSAQRVGELMDAGFDAVFDDADNAFESFCGFVRSIPVAPGPRLAVGPGYARLRGPVQ